jgi:hypothetical protein
MTPDGISTEDWDEVHGHALAVVNAETDEASDAATRDLLACLDRLEDRYGERPSILATRADYVDDEQHQRLLLERAYDLATGRDDHRNALWTALDLVKLRLQQGALGDAEGWLSRAREHLDHGTEHELALCADLTTRLAHERDST